MNSRVLFGERGIVVSMPEAGDLDTLCETYGRQTATSGFLIEAEAAKNMGGLGLVTDTISYNSNDRVVSLYRRTAADRLSGVSNQHFARLMGDCDVAGVIVQPSADITVDRIMIEGPSELDTDGMYDDLYRLLGKSQVASIVDLGVLPEAEYFDVDQVWDWIVSPVRRNVRALVVPGSAPESVGRLKHRLDAEVGPDEVVLMAECPDRESLLRNLDATGNRLHVIIPGALRLRAHEMPCPSAEYEIAHHALQGYFGSPEPVSS